MKKQAYNPFLPSYEYVPDGEPHVFGDRVYLYGSHDRFNGNEFCVNDYVCYSADVHNLGDWRYEGIIFKKTQDPRNPEGKHNLFAPDVVKGLDGRYYLYYCFDILPEIGVAVCDAPAGQYEYLGVVKHKDGTILGQREGDYIQFDPGIFIEDDQKIYLYSGNAPRTLEDKAHKSSQVMILEPDMITLREEPKTLMPDIRNSQGTGFEGHEFFEASSIRKVYGRYYLVYSSVINHELCYAISDKPDRDFQYGGILVSIADIGYQGITREQSLNYLGNTHGGMEQIDGTWYVFYHRQTNRTQFSRQGCAEEIKILEDGSIQQVEITSCGLNGGPLVGEGTYEARIACNLLSKEGPTFSHPMAMKPEQLYFTQEGEDRENQPNQFIKNIHDGAIIGFKYFDFKKLQEITVKTRGDAKGKLLVMTSLEGDVLGEISIAPSGDWSNSTGKVAIPDGKHALYFKFEGEKSLDFSEFTLI